LFAERRRTGGALAVLSDRVSARINEITDPLKNSKLYNNHALRNAVLTAAVPATLLEGQCAF
jgi:hypothetical protein